MRLGIVELYCGASGKKGFYNSQELGLARAMAHLGVTPYIFMPDSRIAAPLETVTDDGIVIVSVPAKNIGVHSRYDWNILLKYQIEAVQLGADNQLFAPELLHFCEKHNIFAYCYIGTTGSTGGGLKSKLLNLLYRRNIRAYKAHPCFAKTPTVQKALTAFGIPNVKIAPVGLDLSVIPTISEGKAALRKTLNLPEDVPVYLFVGRMDSYKRPKDALDVMEAVPGYLVMIGSGTMNAEIAEEITKRGLSHRVRRIEKLPNAEVQPYYKACDCFLNCNAEEIFGMSVLEAMYHGCTVIARHAPGPNFIIENGKNGFLVDNPQEMIALLQKNLRIPPEAATERILNRFVWAASAREFRAGIEVRK